MKKSALFALSAFALTAAPAVIVTAPAQAQMVVYDPSNYAQSVLQATRALQQINNQILSLQNEAVMLQNMAKNLKKFDVSALAGLNKNIAAIDALMKEAKGIALNLDATRQAFSLQFPGAYGRDLKFSDLLSGAETRWKSVMDAYSHTLNVQAQISETLADDAAALNHIVSAAESSDGALEAQQASNQLLALTAKQQMQIQSLLAAQGRAEALDAARKAEAEAAAKAATRRFLGSGKAGQ
ncbi:P-type conjugative transfer protein TrbJ [Asticcacaulis machinosus]|uniref:P-type conjugative transfer protein TrbJ n=1 Tax=Asticcacaulis machinosus TaxID=2984211 RepID=A0ABT5HFW8_9CAUL|nr:P-type conjugative transfer protein TrbJ [Asticcacaulis machinosus]MDC7675152.1 P-type conjugative transfer protein TrbJ [Asticcacaulis machinosus]